MTLEATLLRHGRLLATQTKRSLIGGCAKSCTSLSRLAAPSLTSNTSTSGSLRFNSGGGVAGTLPTPQYAHKSTHRRSIHSSNLTNLAIASPSQPNLRTLTPNVRDAILSELQQVDIDQNGIINATELKILLSKHATAFTDDEVVELTELFYASTGGHGVEVMRFLEALDAAIAEKSTSGGGEMSEGERSPLVEGGKFKTHPLGIGTCASEYMFSKTHGKYTPEQLEIELTHLPPVTNMDKGALFAVKCFRFGFDQATGWNRGVMTPEKILNRAIFLETVAAIPGMVAAIIRHFRSLRNMTRDGGMLNMFLEEANNERMHLLTFIRLKDPGMIFRAAVIGAQGVFATGFGLAYVASPAFCHRFVGYIEEEACLTYTKIIKAIEEAEEGSELAQWKTQDAPKIAKGYWHLGDNGTVLDVMKAVRADEAEHRDVNHAVSGVPDDTVNPLYDPRERLDSMLTKYVKDIMEREQQENVDKKAAATS
eukprot:scaffold7247_cov143-Skeletonema_menzelii.AAC.10